MVTATNRGLRAGLLRHRVTVQSLTPTTDTQGGRSTTTTTVLSRASARVEAVSGAELVQSRAMGAEQQYRVTLRAIGSAAASIVPKMIAVWHNPPFGDLSLQIHAVLPSERGEYLVLECGAVR
jgi:head-tail adaptor